MQDPLGVKGVRKSFSHYKKDIFARGVAPTVEAFVNTILGNGRMKPFINAYEEGTITSVEVYREIKPIFDEVVESIQGVKDGDENGAIALFKRLLEVRGELITRISSKGSEIIEKKKTNTAPDKKNIPELNS